MPTDAPARLCRLCQVNPVAEGKAVCTACWQLAPGWVKKSFMKGEPVQWAKLLEPGSNSPASNQTED